MRTGFAPSVWRENLPTGSYIEGLDQVLGRFCAFSHSDHVDIIHFERRMNGTPVVFEAEVGAALSQLAERI